MPRKSLLSLGIAIAALASIAVFAQKGGPSRDDVIEAVRCPRRPFYLGVQWHPERTEDEAMGVALVRGLVEAARRR